MDKMVKRINKMLQKQSKFASQVSRIEDLEEKYTYLHKFTIEQQRIQKVHDTVNDLGEDRAHIESVELLDGLMTTVELIKSQVKNLIIANETIENDSSYFDKQLDLIQQDKIPQKELKERQLSEIDEEVSKTKLEEAEQQRDIEKDLRHHYEQCFNKVATMTSLNTEVKQLLSQLANQVKQLHQSKLESKMVSQKLIRSEIRYNQLVARDGNSNLFKHQLISLKQNIEKDRLQLNHLERKIENCEMEIKGILGEVHRLDNNRSWADRDSAGRTSALEAQLNEMRRNFEDVSQKKEWAEAKLQEVEQQISAFLGSESATYSKSAKKRLTRFDRPNSALGQTEQSSLPPSGLASKTSATGGRLSLKVSSPAKHQKCMSFEKDRPLNHYQSLREFSGKR